MANLNLTPKGEALPYRAPEFGSLLDLDLLRQLEEKEKAMGVKRRISMSLLTKSGQELADMGWADGDTFMEFLEQAMRFEEHAKVVLELAQAATARLIMVAEALSAVGAE